jgi:hypothetical protein
MAIPTTSIAARSGVVLATLGCVAGALVGAMTASPRLNQDAQMCPLSARVTTVAATLVTKPVPIMQVCLPGGAR